MTLNNPEAFMKHKRSLALFAVLTFLFSTTAFAEGDGTLDQAASPTGAGPAGKMYSLTAIYNRLHSGTAASKGSGFTEPAAGPADGAVYTLNNILDGFNTDVTTIAGNAAAAGDVVSGKKFFATTGTTRGTNWGPVTGTYTPPAGGGLPRTGQTTVYQAGDDGTYQEGVPAAPGAQFTASVVGSDHIVTDNGTGLVWAAYDDEAGCNNGGSLDWGSAITYCEGLTFAGQSDWRLPNIKELVSIVDYGRFSPAIDTAIFPTAKSRRYWSSTTSASSTGYAWFVYFGNGYVGSSDKADTSYVRAVRGGQ